MYTWCPNSAGAQYAAIVAEESKAALLQLRVSGQRLKLQVPRRKGKGALLSQQSAQPWASHVLQQPLLQCRDTAWPRRDWRPTLWQPCACAQAGGTYKVRCED